MAKRIVIIGEDGDVVVKIARDRDEVRVCEKDVNGSKLLISKNLIPQMEIRVESVFRPGKEDVETCYALSGNDVLTNLHKFASSQVIKEATPLEIHTKTEAKVRQIMEETFDSGLPSTVVDVHTHPGGVAELSPQDLSANANAYRVYSRFFRNVYFAVHAVSDEGKFRRSKPEVRENRITWSSINREHEVAFYDVNGKPVEVQIV